MRVAAVYDIHGNLPALQAVLADIMRKGVDEIVVGGDVVPGPMPGESLSLLLGASVPVRFIRGNGESDLLAVQRGEDPDRVPARVRPALRWVLENLDQGHLEEIATWPLTLTLPVDGLGEALFCHATPRDDNELFTRATPEQRLHPVFASVSAGLVSCGHTHMQFDRIVGRVRVVNAGSVGMPFGEPGAYWALLGPDVDLRRTRYDLVSAQARLAMSTYPGASEIDLLNPPSEQEMIQVFEAASLPSGSGS